MDNLQFLISSLRWQDIVDIGLVSYILLRFYVLFRGTNAFRVLIGMILLWFFQQVAVSMGLIVTSWVVQGVVAVVLKYLNLFKSISHPMWVRLMITIHLLMCKYCNRFKKQLLIIKKAVHQKPLIFFVQNFLNVVPSGKDGGVRCRLPRCIRYLLL